MPYTPKCEQHGGGGGERFFTSAPGGVSGKLHALAALQSGKLPLVSIVQKAGWAPKPVWTLWNSEKKNLLFVPRIEHD
jgi:hypothetical protein